MLSAISLRVQQIPGNIAQNNNHIVHQHESHLAELQEDGRWVCIRHQLEVFDRGVCHPAPEVEAVGAELLIPLGRLVAHDHSVALPVAPLVPARQVPLVRNWDQSPLWSQAQDKLLLMSCLHIAMPCCHGPSQACSADSCLGGNSPGVKGLSGNLSFRQS